MVAPAPPFQAIAVEKCADVEKTYRGIVRACRLILKGWEGLHDEQVEISFISGGISNALYKVAPAAGAGLSPVAFRIYGDNTENFIDRGEELRRMALLHSEGFGPELLGVFETGRIEEFLPLRCLQPPEMAAPRFVPTIARTLRRFHAVQRAEQQQQQEGVEGGAPRTPFARILEWLDTAERFHFQDPQKQRCFERFDFQELRREVQEVQGVCRQLGSPTVFAHCDLLSGNIMVQDRGGESSPPQAMTFIDFEYAEAAPRGFDIGNHFCEYAGFECDYGRYPGREAAELFLRHYLAGEGGRPEDVEEVELRACLVEVNAYALAAHQYWGTWSFLQAQWSSIDFDYLEYAQLRWGEYRRRKKEFLGAARAWLAQHGAAVGSGLQ